MLRSLGAAMLLWAWLTPCAAAQATPAPFGELRRLAQQAQQSRDYPALLEQLNAMLALRPNYPPLLYGLAATQALLGQHAEAIRSLQALADMGLSYELTDEPAFESLSANTEFVEILGRMDVLRQPQGQASLAFEAGSRRFIPEGLAFDAASGSFFLGSVHERRILRIGNDGNSGEFVASAASGLWSVLGLSVDPEHDLLWAASSAFPEMQDYDPIVVGRSALFAFSLDQGELLRRYPVPADGRLHAVGDVLVGAGGEIWSTDAAAGEVLALERESGAYRVLNTEQDMVSPQGLAQSADGSALYVADYAQGLFLLELRSGQWQRLASPDTVCLYGIDGLYRWGGDLIAVQNGVRPHRVLRIELAADGKSVVGAEVLAAALADFDEPTLGTVVGDEFLFVANSHWSRFDEQHRLPEDDRALSPPRILRLPLKRSAATTAAP